MHFATQRFWKAYDNLDAQTQKLADKSFALLKQNPSYPSLHFKSIGKLYSVRISITHRALALKSDGDYIWVWVGNHDEYDKLIK